MVTKSLTETLAYSYSNLLLSSFTHSSPNTLGTRESETGKRKSPHLLTFAQFSTHMDYAARWTQPQPPPHHHHPPYNPYGAPPSQPHHLNLLHHPQQQPQPQPQEHLVSYSSVSYYPNRNPNPSPVPNYTNPNPSVAAVDPYLPDPYAPHGGYSVGPAAGSGLAAYYYGRIGGESHGFAVKEAIRQYGVDPINCGQVPPRPSNGMDPSAPLHVVPPQRRVKLNYKGGSKKGSKMTKAVQSAYCGVCKIDCSSPEVLTAHKKGKKHKKNLQKLQESITPKPQRAQVMTDAVEKKEALSSDKGTGTGSKQTKRKEATEEDLETKKRKILDGGAEPNEVKVCTLCNVVVNSQKVYNSHLAGSKHAAMVKKQQEAAAS